MMAGGDSQRKPWIYLIRYSIAVYNLNELGLRSEDR